MRFEDCESINVFFTPFEFVKSTGNIKTIVIESDNLTKHELDSKFNECFKFLGKPEGYTFGPSKYRVSDIGSKPTKTKPTMTFKKNKCLFEEIRQNYADLLEKYLSNHDIILKWK